MITPTVGRKVWYRPSQRDLDITGMCCIDPEQPFDATVCCVRSANEDGRTRISVSVRDHYARSHSVTSVILVQDGEEKPIDQPYCEWMPYQIKIANQQQTS